MSRGVAIRRPRLSATPRRRPVQREKHEQVQVVQLLTSLGGRVYVLGTRRRRGAPCPHCGAFVAEHQGTRQTPGIGDVLAYLPPPPLGARLNGYVALWVECKAAGGRLSDDQQAFRTFTVGAGIAHVVGGLNDVIAWCLREGYLKPDQVLHERLPKEMRSCS